MTLYIDNSVTRVGENEHRTSQWFIITVSVNKVRLRYTRGAALPTGLDRPGRICVGSHCEPAVSCQGNDYFANANQYYYPYRSDFTGFLLLRTGNRLAGRC